MATMTQMTMTTSAMSRPKVAAEGDERQEEEGTGRYPRRGERRQGVGDDDGNDLLVVVPPCFVDGRADGGAGEFFTTTSGQGGAYVPPWFLPTVSSTGAGMKCTCRPLSNSFPPPPPRWGGLCLQLRYRRLGGGVQPTHRPHTSSFTPLNGGDSFFLYRFIDGGWRKSQTPPPSP